MSVHSLRMRSTQGSSSNIMEWLIPLKNSRTNFPITKTTDAYNPMMLQGERDTKHKKEDKKHEEKVSGYIMYKTNTQCCCTWWALLLLLTLLNTANTISTASATSITTTDTADTATITSTTYGATTINMCCSCELNVMVSQLLQH